MIDAAFSPLSRLPLPKQLREGATSDLITAIEQSGFPEMGTRIVFGIAKQDQYEAIAATIKVGEISR